MSFVGNVLGSIGKALGLVQEAPPVPVAPVAPTADNSYQAMDTAAQSAAASVSRGATSTMLTGGTGELDDQKYTSKILLGN